MHLLLRILTFSILIFNFSIADDKLMINGLSYHIGETEEKNSYNYGLGYSIDNHELGFYRNSRVLSSYSVYYTWNKEFTKISDISFGYKLGGAIYDSSAHYNGFFKPIIAAYGDIPMISNSFLRISATYGLVTAQLVFKID